MDILHFIFGLGIALSIFGFLWGIIMLILNFLRRDLTGNRQVQDYVLRIVKYFLLVSVVANYILLLPSHSSRVLDLSQTAMIVIGVLVLGLYLLGKLQKRAMLSQLSANPMFAKYITQIDPKVERFLLIGSLVYFVLCLLNPVMVNNSVVNWFTLSIVDIYDTPVIGWVFAIIAFVFLVNIIMKAANVLGAIVTGQPINPAGGAARGPFGNFQGNAGSNPFDQFREKQNKSEDFVDYEDVTDENDDSTNSDDENKLN